jgi:hypothetical protein
VELGEQGHKINIIDYCGDEEIIRHPVDAIIFMCTDIKNSCVQTKILKLLSNAASAAIPILILENKKDGLMQEHDDLIEDYDNFLKEKSQRNRAVQSEYKWLLGSGTRITFRQISCYSKGGIWESFSWLIHQLKQ